MLARGSRFVWLSVALFCALVAVACEKVPLLAPSGSTITLNAATTVLSANATTTIIAQVLEAAGTPPHSGTRVTFTTNLGRIEPPNVETDAAGQAVVTFVANGTNGTAVISATSGGAATGSNGALRLSVGSAAVGKIFLNANPSVVPAAGGSSAIGAIVLDVNGNPLSATPIAFTTTAGSLSSTLVLTDANGVASVVLTTSQAATITASVGAQGSSGTTTPGTGTTTPAPSGVQQATLQIPVSAAPTIGITPPTQSPSKGLPAMFTFVVTAAAQNGNTVRDVVVNWGDGTTESLGSITGSAQVFHVFKNDGTFTVSATVSDVAGGTNRASTSIVVIPVPRPTIQITSSPVPGKVNTQTTISIQITVPSGIGISETVLNFGDGTSANLGGAQSAAQPHVYTVQGTYTVTVTVTDTSGQTTVGNAIVSIGP